LKKGKRKKITANGSGDELTSWEREYDQSALFLSRKAMVIFLVRAAANEWTKVVITSAGSSQGDKIL